MNITITEALSEIKTVSKRIASKREFIGQFLSRPDGLRDPLEKEGGSVEVLQKELQAIGDLEKRIVELRRGIQKANEANSITLEGETKTIADWLHWRRDVAPAKDNFLNGLRRSLQQIRDQSRRNGNVLVNPGAQAEKPTDMIVNINEKDLAAESEKLNSILGQLDGQLSLKNATVTIL